MSKSNRLRQRRELQTRLLAGNKAVYQDRVRRHRPKHIRTENGVVTVVPKTFVSARRQAKKDAQALLEGAKIHEGEGDELLEKIETTSTRKLSHLNF